MQIKKIIYYLGIDANPVSHLEKIISGIGGFLSIFSIIYIRSLYVGVEAVYVIPSMGASAVLLFAGTSQCTWTALECNRRTWFRSCIIYYRGILWVLLHKH